MGRGLSRRTARWTWCDTTTRLNYHSKDTNSCECIPRHDIDKNFASTTSCIQLLTLPNIAANQRCIRGLRLEACVDHHMIGRILRVQSRGVTREGRHSCSLSSHAHTRLRSKKVRGYAYMRASWWPGWNFGTSHCLVI